MIAKWHQPGTQGDLPSGFLERIKHLRRLMLVHCHLYYRMDESIVSDHQWQQWAWELRDLQEASPDACCIGFYDKEFEGWDGSTGYHLPTDADIDRVARRTLKAHNDLHGIGGTNKEVPNGQRPRRKVLWT